EQLNEEFKNVIDLSLYVLGSLGFEDFITQVSIRDPEEPEKYLGAPEVWEKAEQAIINAAEEKGINYTIEKGEAAFYGPKLDFMVRDALGRKWQLGTIQVDYNLPERFGLSYKGKDNELHQPVMIHRAPFGSMERFMALLLEHTGGNFPLWLTPDQAMVLPVSEKYEKYAEKVLKSLENHEIRALVDKRNETVGKKIREAEVQKVPFMLVVGEKEEETGTVAVRKHGGEDLGSISVEAFADLVEKEISSTLKSF
ncbi:MAG: His/Gly/Thr/Pro-type tRNA ligase C-terminal domain-containing protein, partial [Flavobacteriaceae bacterium]